MDFVKPQNQFDKPVIIRKAQELDIPLLEAVERSAAILFRENGLAFLADGDTMDQKTLFSMKDSGNLWVAVGNQNQPIGFLGGYDLDGYFYIAELSVSEAAQGNGIGKMLINSMMADIKPQEWKGVTLLTYRDLYFNGPWYGRQGFKEVEPAVLGEGHVAMMAEEALHGHDISKRCALRRYFEHQTK